MLRGIQKSYVLVRNSIKKTVVDQLAAQTGVKNSFPGAQPVTLQRENMATEASPDVANIRFGDYNVTDKADGQRCFMIVARDGRMYMIDRNLNVYNTGRRLGDAETAEWNGTVLDGEWVTNDKENKPVSRYFSFDILYGRRGEDVTGRPFLTRSVDGAEPPPSRHKELMDAVSALDKSAYVLKKMPEHHKLSIHAKVFETVKDPAAEPNGIFAIAASVLDRVQRDSEYHTDGLIFTPNAQPLPKTGGRWMAQFKWKPASMNSVDFLVVTEKERSVSGKPTQKEYITTKLREDTNQIVRVKTLRLFVGGATHPALENPRDTVLQEKPFPKPSELRANYRPVEFAPQPPDPMGAICYVAINAGATDAAGAAPEAQELASFDDNIYCEETGDPINDRTIVEMVYNVNAPAGWRWKPLRVRWDKTEKFGRGEISGTLNSEGNANDVWQSIHDPITEKMIRTGATTDDTPVVEGSSLASAVAYYQRRAPQRDLAKISTMVDFHNNYIKQMLLTRALLNKGMALMDMSCGQAGDLHRWVEKEPSWVLGCDIAEAGLADPKNGAYSRYLNKMIRARGTIPPMLFIQADSSLNYTDGSAGMSPADRAMLRVLWGEEDSAAPPAAQRLAGRGALGFDSAACMFSLHYFFKDRASLDGFMSNVARTVKVGGLFVGCCFDGDAIAALLKDHDVGGAERGVDSGTELWTITKQYDDKTGIVPPTDEGLGRAIDVNFISIGEAYREYLVSFPFLVEQMKAIGFEPLNEEELGEFGLVNSSNMFSESHAMAAGLGKAFPMLPVVQRFSFLNRWFIFRRRRTTGLAVMPVMKPRGTKKAAAAAAAAVVEEVKEEEEEAAESPILENESPANSAESPAAENTEEGGELAVADGPIYLFSHRAAKAKREELKALGIKEKNWRRYISTVTPFEFSDRSDPSIVYPNFEAAIAAAKIQVASKKPELGPQLFSITGNLHQEILGEEMELGDAINDDQKAELAEKEVKAIFAAMKPKALKTVGIKKIVGEAWEEQREEIIVDYVRQRLEADTKFSAILAALGAQKARLVYNYMASGDLAGSVDDETISGDNLYGRALMRAVGLTY